MLGKKQGKQRLELVSDYVVFDIETTGISCRYDDVVELSALKVKDGKVVEEFSTLVKADRPISYGASMVNGITDDMLIDAPTFDTVLSDFIEFIESEPYKTAIENFDPKKSDRWEWLLVVSLIRKKRFNILNMFVGKDRAFRFFSGAYKRLKKKN